MEYIWAAVECLQVSLLFVNTYWGLSAYEYIRQYGYVPYNVLDTSSVGRQTREASRTLEYSFEDFGIRQVAQLLGHTDDEERYTNRSYVRIARPLGGCCADMTCKWYRNVWDSSVESDGFTGNLWQMDNKNFVD